MLGKSEALHKIAQVAFSTQGNRREQGDLPYYCNLHPANQFGPALALAGYEVWNLLTLLAVDLCKSRSVHLVCRVMKKPSHMSSHWWVSLLSDSRPRGPLFELSSHDHPTLDQICNAF